MQRKILTLLDIIKDQAKVNVEQSEMIETLVNENLEKENMINEIIKDIETE